MEVRDQKEERHIQEEEMHCDGIQDGDQSKPQEF